MIEIIETVEIETYEILTAAIDTGERRTPTVMEIIAGLDLEDAIKDLVARGEVCAVYAWHQQAWREAVEVSGIDPRNGWTDEGAAKAALVDFFTDRDARQPASAILKAGV
ncbi:Uncharacterised protein [Mycobacteroides abscessus subsp. abscessus]|uniref:hypothetical protein n=1 Tax=Mycobacteroides abscessus TaxID=36809 RepID=UPI000928B9B0|nr:hypothetical protein [Mycobacteroides abscessus]SIH15472.1 Uncharacterised protein [Mycobacteroides abscessus subsp. abscessus]SLI47897.1 Uncharacterised protein [Mycobacteroides abscessus subsp. abscessus]